MHIFVRNLLKSKRTVSLKVSQRGTPISDIFGADKILQISSAKILPIDTV